MQVTIADERWYLKPSKDEEGKPTIVGVPSVTWIAGSYPKGVGFYKWLAERGWDEAQAVKEAAGNKGSKIHMAIAAILNGEEVRIDSKFMNRDRGVEEELTLEECDAILSFLRWRDKVKPETIVWEQTVFSDKYNYAGTVDYICKIGEDYWVIDFKTGQTVWPEYELQVSAYRQTIENGENHFEKVNAAMIKTAILQIGYRRNKDGYRFVEIENQFPLFLAARQIWHKEHGGENISKVDYPIVISAAKVPEKKAEEPAGELPARKVKKTKTT